MLKFSKLGTFQKCVSEMCTAAVHAQGFFMTQFQPPWSFTDLYRLSKTRKCPLSDLAERLSNRDELKANSHLLGSWHTQIHF